MPEFGTAKNVMLEMNNVKWAINSFEATHQASGSSKRSTILSLKSIALTRRE
jgi:hypothetical protein